MKNIIFAVSLIGALFAANVADAQHRSGHINRTQKDQRHRIHHGIKNGSITRHEAKQLRGQQAKIRHYKQMAKADGRITPRERAIIRHEQRRANRNIYVQKHDGQNRFGYNRYKR